MGRLCTLSSRMFWWTSIRAATCIGRSPFAVVSHADLHVFLEAIHVFTETGVLWDARPWSQKLGRKLSLYHWGAPITSLPNEHADFTEDPQVNFTAMRSPLPTSSHLHSFTVTFEDHDEEEDRKERTLMTGAKS